MSGLLEIEPGRRRWMQGADQRRDRVGSGEIWSRLPRPAGFGLAGPSVSPLLCRHGLRIRLFAQRRERLGIGICLESLRSPFTACTLMAGLSGECHEAPRIYSQRLAQRISAKAEVCQRDQRAHGMPRASFDRVTRVAAYCDLEHGF